MFCATTSSTYQNSTTNYKSYYAFNKTQSGTPAWNQNTWNGADDIYSDSTGLYTGSVEIGGIKGDWIKLKFPYQIKLQGYEIKNRGAWYKHVPDNWVILGSNDDNNWETVDSVTSTASGTSLRTSRIAESSGETVQSRHLTVDSTKYYKYLALVTTKLRLGPSPANVDNVNFSELIFFGTPGPTTLDKGSLTLGRSLDVPRISRYDVDTETPRPEKLVLDLDTTVNSSPTDISGKGNHGAFNGGATYSPADKAFKFDGSTDYIKGNLNNTGDTDFTVSLWLKKNTSGTVGMLWNFGGSGGSGNPEDSVALEVGSSNNLDYFIFSGVEGAISNFGTTYLNRWVHIVATRSGNNLKIYLDGVDQNLTTTNTDTLQLAANTEYTIGARGTGALGNNSLNGCISNFKVYDVVLEPSEVKKLYNLGRTGRSMVISDTAVGIGKVPEAQLDVRGTSGFDAIKVGIPKRGDGHTASLGRIVVATPIGPPDRSFASGSVYTGIRIVGTDATNNLSMGVGDSGYNWEPWIQAAYDNSTTSSSSFGNKTLRLQPRGGSTTTNGSTVNSDDRVKVDETYIVNATETLMKLKPQTYTRYAMMVDKTRPDLDSWKRYEAGLITQEVYYDAPELRHIVNMSDDADLSGEDIKTSDDPSVDPDYRNWGSSVSSLDYTQLIPYLIKSNQEQEEEIQVLSAIKEKAFLQTSQITLLQNVVFSLTKRIEQLEQA